MIIMMILHELTALLMVVWQVIPANFVLFCNRPNSVRLVANGRVLKYAPGCFEVLLCRSFMIKRTAE